MLFKVTYLLALLIEMFIRIPHDRERRQAVVTKDQASGLEYALLTWLFVGMFLLPLIYTFTPWLDFANYTLPDRAAWVGAGLAVAVLWVFWCAHVDLSRTGRILPKVGA